MTKRAAIGETIMRKTRKATLCLGKPLFSVYNPSTATNYAERIKPKNMGFTNQFSRFL